MKYLVKRRTFSIKSCVCLNNKKDRISETETARPLTCINGTCGEGSIEGTTLTSIPE